MRKFAGIVESTTAPPTNCLWLLDGDAKYFSNGEWKSLIGVGGAGDEDRQELEEKVDSLDKEMGTAEQNVTKLQKSKLTYVYLQIGNSNEVKQANLAALTGISGFFFTELDYGYGVGTYQASVGGFAHVVTAHDNNAYYDISTDGSITKNEDYISPNEPYTVNLTSDKIDVTLDDITAGKVNKCGEITVVGSTGPITYTRTSDSTATTIYFISDRKDGKVTLLTYNVNTKVINSNVVNLPLPAATSTQFGAIKKSLAIEDLVVSSATVESIAYKVNDILQALRSSGVIIS